MIPDTAFLRRLPTVLDRTEVVLVEALVFSADAIDASFAAIRRVTTKYREEICGAPRLVHVELFTHAWTIVDCLHVVRGVLAGLDYKTPLAVAFLERYECATKLRNRMDHLTDNAKNVANSKGRPPVFGGLGYICVPNESFLMQEGHMAMTGGGIVTLSTGRFWAGQAMTLVNPAGITMHGPVGGFRLEAFDHSLELEQAVTDLRELMAQVNDNLEKDMNNQAEALSKEHGVPVEKLLSHPGGGFSFYLAFGAGNPADPKAQP